MKRILTAVVALPILLYSIWSESPYFVVGLTTIAVLLALSEFYGLASKVGCNPQGVAGYGAAVVVVASFVLEQPMLTVAAPVALSIVSLTIALSKPDEMKAAFVSVSATVFGVIYIALLAGCLAGVRVLSDGPTTPRLAPKLLTLFFALVMITDTGAFYTGRLIGRHKLAPRISPGKTIEGAIGGFVMAVVTGFLCKLIFFREIPVAHA